MTSESWTKVSSSHLKNGFWPTLQRRTSLYAGAWFQILDPPPQAALPPTTHNGI